MPVGRWLGLNIIGGRNSEKMYGTRSRSRGRELGILWVVMINKVKGSAL